MKIRSKVVEKEAVRVPFHEYADNPLVFDEIPEWLQEAVTEGTIRPEFRSEDYWYYVIKTLEGEMTATPGDWIIRGLAGELYPCNPDILAKSYESIPEVGHDKNRCAVCGWPLAESVTKGCVRGNCSQRPMPEADNYYDRERSNDEAAALHAIKVP